MMNKGKKLEKLVLATILAGSMVVGNNAFAATLEDEYDFLKLFSAIASIKYELNFIKQEDLEKVRKTIATGLSEILELDYNEVYEKTKENIFEDKNHRRFT